MNNQIIKNIFLMCLSMISISVAAAPITYSVFDDLGGATISGSITTDGTIGNIGNANITDWDILLDDGTYSSTLNSVNSFLHSSNSSTNFSATLSTLSFDHSFGNFFLFFANDLISYWCLEGPNDGCSGIASSSNIAINNSGSRIFYHRFDTGIQTFDAINRIPEPASIALLGIGLAGIGLSRKKRNV